jgi:hypothetical protein
MFRLVDLMTMMTMMMGDWNWILGGNSLPWRRLVFPSGPSGNEALSVHRGSAQREMAVKGSSEAQ